nr:hypothetical protein [Tanacetum cinerariifolium]
MVFYKIETEEISDRFVAPCFINGLEAYDGEINLGVEENMTLNEFAVKLCLEHEVKHGHKVVKKELIVALRREIYLVKFIINPKEDDVEPGVVFGRLFLRLTKAIADVRNETVTIYPKLDHFLVSSDEGEKIGDDWDLLLDNHDFGDILDIDGVGPSMSTGTPLTQKEVGGEALAISIYERYSLLEEERRVIETMALYELKLARHLNYSDSLDRSLALQEVMNPFRKICVWKKVVSFLGSLPVALQHVEWKPDYTGCFNKKEDSDGQWHAEIRLTNPYRNTYDQGFVTKKTTRKLANLESTPVLEENRHTFQFFQKTIETHDDEAGSSRPKHSRQYETVEEVLLPQVHLEILEWEGCNRDAKSRLGLYHAEDLDEEGFGVYFQGGLNSYEHFNAQKYWLSISREENLSLYWSHASTIRNLVLRVLHKIITYGLCQRTTRWMKRKGAGTQRESLICCRQFIMKLDRKAKVLSDKVIRNLSALIYCRDLDTTMLRELIALREAIKMMAYRQSYHQDRYAGVFEHMVGVTVFNCKKLTTHLDMLNHNIISIVSSINLSHNNNNNNNNNNSRMMSSVEMILVGFATACSGLQDDVEPGVVFGRLFLRLTKAITDVRNETVTIYPKLNPFLVSSDEGEKIGDDWDLLLDNHDFGDILDIDGVGPSMSTGTPLTQEEVGGEALAISIYERYSLLEEERHQHVEWKPDYTGCFNKKEDSDGQWHAEIRLTNPYGNTYDKGFVTKKTTRKLANLESTPVLEENRRTFQFFQKTMGTHDDEAGSSRPKHSRQYETVEELKTKKIIKFRLGGRANNLTLLEFARRVGLYHDEDLDEEGFGVYFQGGLNSYEHFNAQKYWLSISQEENLSLYWSHASTIRNPVLRVLHKIITYGLCQRTARQFIMKLDRKAKVLSDKVIRNLSALIYCRDLDTTILKELINSEGRLIPEDP